MNSLPGKKSIVAFCKSTDFKNGRLKSIIGILCMILLGIGVGYHIARYIDLSVPEIPMWITIALVSILLLFSILQMLMRPTHITFFPEPNENIILMNDRIYWVTNGSGTDCSYTVLFEKDFKIKKLFYGNDIIYRIYGKPSAQLIELFKKSRENEDDGLHPYLFESISLAIQPTRAEDVSLQQKLLIRKIKTAFIPRWE